MEHFAGLDVSVKETSVCIAVGDRGASRGGWIGVGLGGEGNAMVGRLA